MVFSGKIEKRKQYIGFKMFLEAWSPAFVRKSEDL